MAAERLDTPSLSKMLLTWRATVFSLMNNSSAMARFVLPDARRRSTCASRSLSEPTGSLLARFGCPPMRARRKFGVELLEQPPRGLDVETPALVITPPLTDSGHQKAGMRLFVRHPQIAPDLGCLAEPRRRTRNVAFREEHGASRVGGRRVQQRGSDGACDRRQLCGRRPRVFEITGGQQDFDGRGEHSCPRRLCPRVEQNAAD